MKTILEEGVNILRQGDSDIEAVIAPRHEEIISHLSKYIAEIETFNPAYGLVGTTDLKELIIKHILDSLAPLGIIYRLLVKMPSHNIADAGSGAGLPGIPLAIALPRFYITLIERMGRRAGFLWNTKASLGLSNITVEEGEIERTAPGSFQLITFRAFQTLEPKLLKALFRACAKGGCLAAYKGRRKKIEEEMAPLEKFCGSWEAIPCPVPFLEEERHLLIITPP
ncbi:MAG: 16S rRNA (guanine(527)-N(7))-methyltransferase RsmG [Treponema sp.]|nr:16S rRNA (guanine(527)-N(7))-methyltransferase RsmG [Treponema sp.]